MNFTIITIIILIVTIFLFIIKNKQLSYSNQKINRLVNEMTILRSSTRKELEDKNNNLNNLKKELTTFKYLTEKKYSELKKENEYQIENNKKIIENIENMYSQENLNLSNSITQYLETIKTLENKLKEEDTIKKVYEVKKSLTEFKLSPIMTELYNDFNQKYLNDYVHFFLNKKNPSKKSADYIKEIQSEFKSLKIKNKELELALSEFTEESIIKSLIAEKNSNTFDTEKEAQTYSSLSKDEWKNLSDIEKLDIVLERYKNSKKNKLGIGLEFERYCGYLFEQKGYKVKYNGILKEKSDGGIDLIATNDSKKIFIQCKYWSLTKTIRENTITQLFGSSLKMALDNNETFESFLNKIKSNEIELKIMTKTKLSEEAKEFCNLLYINYEEEIIIEDYPIVKLVHGEDKIFYIPTDLQYDKICFGSKSKEYSREYSCKNAFEKGYRHSYRWKG